MSCGIYKIKNKITDDCYVGSSINIEVRHLQHLLSLNKGKHHSLILQCAFDKYTIENLELNILEICEESKLKEREDFYLSTINPLYNILKKAYSFEKVKWSEERKLKARKYALDNNFTPPKKTWMYKRKPVIMLDKITNEELKDFESASEAARFLGKSSASSTNIIKVCKEKREHIFGFKWKYKI